MNPCRQQRLLQQETQPTKANQSWSGSRGHIETSTTGYSICDSYYAGTMSRPGITKQAVMTAFHDCSNFLLTIYKGQKPMEAIWEYKLFHILQKKK
jgi:hypothetical protein